MTITPDSIHTPWQDKILIGIPILAIGVLMNVVVFLAMPNPLESIDTLFFATMAACYGVVANLLVLVGLKKIFGARPVFDRIIGSNFRRLVWLAVGLSLVTVAAALLAALSK